MLLYIFIVIWIFCLSLFGVTFYAKGSEPQRIQNKSKKARKKVKRARFLAFITLVFLWVLTAFRSSNIGNDTKNYIHYFKIFAEGGIDLKRTFELGYQMLNVFIGWFTRDPHIFLIVIATVLYLGASICIFKNSKNILISVCILFCLCFSLFASMFRQGIAMIIALYGFYQLKKNKKARAVILFLLATLFHTSAIVCFFLFIDTKLFAHKYYVLAITVAVSVLSMFGVFNSIIIALFPRYKHYFLGQYASSGWLAVSYEVIRNIVFYVITRKAINSNKREERLVLTNMSALLLCSALGFSVNLFTRLSQYFLLVAVCEIPNVLYSEKIKKKKTWAICICAVLLVMFLLILIFRPNWNHLYPYEFWSVGK